MYFTEQDIQARRQRLATHWNTILQADEAVLVYSGSPIQRPGGLDQTYPFLPHPAYFWLTARRREEEVILYNKNTGWIEFQKAFTKEQAVWEGEKTDLLVATPGQDIKQLDSFLQAQKITTIYHLGQTNKTDLTGKTFELRTVLDQTRRKKDAAEIQLIKQVATIAAAGYETIQQTVRPGITERELQIAYESAIFRQGAHTVPYDTIIGSGANAAILHALPTQKIIREQELVLVDAGADIFDYCVDITRVFPSSNNLSSQQKALYELVLAVQLECLSLAKPGVFWRDVHIQAATRFTEGLLGLGILKGGLSTLVEKQVAAVFFPHGLGHLVGLRVRDTGQEENLAPKPYFGSRLRVDIQLEEGHLITVEPGLYFIKALLEDQQVQQKFKEDISWSELEHWKGIGGVRIEDNILLTEAGNENLTACIPKATSI
jgi:Xaa-Pro aminopeptidase